MILKDVVRERNEVPFRVIENAYKNNKIVHNYLISSPSNINPDYFLFFIAQTLLCEQAFACGACSNCKRVVENKYSDLILLDGSKDQIKKEEIVRAYDILMQTALERKKVKILIMKNVENTSPAAINSLLKFIEEPPKDTYILSSTHSISAVIPTIKSRSQIITLNLVVRDSIITELMDRNVPEDDAHILSIISSSTSVARELIENGSYKLYKDSIITFFQKWINNPQEAKLFLLGIDGKKIDVNIFLRLFLAFLNDIWRLKVNKGISFKNNISLLNELNKKHFPIYRSIEETSKLMTFVQNNPNMKLQIYSWVIKMMGDTIVK